ncbi:unnamed protein product [Dicrocoelium dendriticum]|nr:unnamed protein product [Dicrocoelium dendriticum]
MLHSHKQVEGDAPHSPKEESSDEVKGSDLPYVEASEVKQHPQLKLSPDVVKAIRAQRRAVNPGSRRRSVSFNQFGPTIARSTEHIQLPITVDLRRRCDSCSTSSTWLHLNPADLLFDRGSPAHSLGSETPSLTPSKLDTDVPHARVPSALVDVHGTAGACNCEYSPKPLLSADAVGRTQQPRNRVASGDSGYSCRINFCGSYGFSDVELGVPKSNDLFFPHYLPDAAMHMVSGSTPSLLDPLMSPCALNSLRGTLDSPCGVSAHSNGREDYITSHPHFSTNWNHGIYHGPCGRLMNGGLHLRRHRNPSESSDLDVEEDRRMANNLLHQLMHESHKPSCADHPTNLDQEIGQSILGQIHHELARLHEAGRFLLGSKCSWSRAGLGGLLLRNHGADTELDADRPNADKQCVSPTYYTDASIYWTAVLFHERHAAQLGCLEALIVMIHYYLGLPTQLLLDCPIKPDQNDLIFGVDYLWRAAEGDGRRCMILLVHYLDLSASLYLPKPKLSKYNWPDSVLLLPALQPVRPEARPSIS